MKKIIAILILIFAIESANASNKYEEYLQKALIYAEADGGQRIAKKYFKKYLKAKRRELRWKEIATLSK